MGTYGSLINRYKNTETIGICLRRNRRRKVDLVSTLIAIITRICHLFVHVY